LLAPDLLTQNLRQKGQQLLHRPDVRDPAGADVLDPSGDAARWLGAHIQLQYETSVCPQLEVRLLRGFASL
jgi:hypothetical protein